MTITPTPNADEIAAIFTVFATHAATTNVQRAEPSAWRQAARRESINA